MRSSRHWAQGVAFNRRFPLVRSLGQVVMNNIIAAGFEGEVWPVNPKHREVAGRRCYSNACELPGVPDLGVIVTPPTAVPGVIGELIEKGARAAVVITGGLARAGEAMLEPLRTRLEHYVRMTPRVVASPLAERGPLLVTGLPRSGP